MPTQSIISFRHGLGDCANFAIQLPLYVRRGWDITVVCDDNKRELFELVGVTPRSNSKQAPRAIAHHPWHDSNYAAPPLDNLLQNNKPHQNFLAQPLGPIHDAPLDVLWAECLSRRDISFDRHAAAARAHLANLPKPIFLLHSNGNTSPGSKNMPAQFALDLATQLMQNTAGSIIFLDWDNRAPWFYSGRVRHLTHQLPPELQSVAGLMGLIANADLLIGVDSGPLHLAGIVDAPSIGVWFDHHPVNFAIPRKNCLNIVCKNATATLPAAAIFNTVPNEKADAGFVAAAAVRMVNKPRWLQSPAEDAQLALLLNKCFGRGLNVAGVGDVLGDRSVSFGLALDRLAENNRPPVLVETGCIRADNDWAGAGYSTFVLGLAAGRMGGTLRSIDIDAGNVAYAATACKTLPAVRVIQDDSVAGISKIDGEIDLLYLDSMDTYVTGHAEHGLKEAQFGAAKMGQNGVIIFDDTINVDGKIIGKGALGIPWLQNNGWRVAFSGYQVVLMRQ